MIPYDWAAKNLKKLTAKMYPYKHRAPIKRSKKPLTSGGATVEPAVGPGPDPGAPLT
jgi:hypothetical protein